MGGTLSKPSFQRSRATGSKECPHVFYTVAVLEYRSSSSFHTIEEENSQSKHRHSNIVTIECIIKMCIVVLNSWEFDARCLIRAILVPTSNVKREISTSSMIIFVYSS